MRSFLDLIHQYFQSLVKSYDRDSSKGFSFQRGNRLVEDYYKLLYENHPGAGFPKAIWFITFICKDVLLLGYHARGR